MADIQVQLDVINQEITYNGMPKAIPSTYWTDTLVPLLYPTWDTDKDKLILFVYNTDSTYIAKRRKYVMNFKTNVNEWKDYEMEAVTTATVTAFKDKLIEGWYAVDAVENTEFQNELANIYAKTQNVSPATVRLARDFLLDETDWSQIADCPLSVADKALYTTYRQKLRDISSDPNFNSNALEVKFPISPNFYNRVYKLENAGKDYLATDDQFLKLGLHYLKLFKEKIAYYLLMKSVTERTYFDRMLSEYANHSSKSAPAPLTSAEVQEKKDWLDKLIELASDEKGTL